ncbi:hypothetical protein U1701_18255 [Sphingomonas sp. PB2P19]|uniref:hypothetical protein n=1 Tax=Sphingomonas rhamnosi TaxID=3096156 RepID=UPI002FCC357D
MTLAEQKRVSAVLAAVSTRTLLRSLARLNIHNVDARLIIAELLERLPADKAS